jgi:hypothetical protein
MNLDVLPPPPVLPDCDREFFMNLLQAFNRSGRYLIGGDSSLVWWILLCFPEVRHSPRDTQYVVGHRRFGTMPKPTPKPISRRQVIIKIEECIAKGWMLELGYVPEHKRRREIFEFD